jgi:hypothetical protein
LSGKGASSSKSELRTARAGGKIAAVGTGRIGVTLTAAKRQAAIASPARRVSAARPIEWN